MFRLLFTVFSLCMLVIQAPGWVQQFNAAQATSAPAAQAPRAAKAPAVQTARGSGRRAIIPADSRGHFNVEAKINGRRAMVLVDTGATAVAINQKFARKIGLRLNKSDFKHVANTANGTVKFASAVVKEIKIDRIRVKNVQVAVLPDKALNNILLGMSFLRRLQSFQVRDNQLVLKQ